MLYWKMENQREFSGDDDAAARCFVAKIKRNISHWTYPIGRGVEAGSKHRFCIYKIRLAYPQAAKLRDSPKTPM